MAKTKAENELRVPEGLHRAVGFWIEDYRRMVSDDGSEDLAQQLKETKRLLDDFAREPLSFIVKQSPEPRYVRGREATIQTSCLVDQYHERRLPVNRNEAVPQLRFLHIGLIEGRAVSPDEILEHVSFRGLPSVALKQARTLRQELITEDESLAVHLNEVWYDEDMGRAKCVYEAGVEISRCGKKVGARGLNFESNQPHLSKERLADLPGGIDLDLPKAVDSLFDLLNGLEVRRNRR